MKIAPALVLAALLLASGCANAAEPPPVPQPTETPTSAASPPRPTETPLPPTPTASLTPAPSPTRTLTPSPIPTATGTPSPTAPAAFYGTVISSIANVRTGPGIVYDSLGALGQDVRVEITGRSESGDWAYVDLGQGQSGWISTQLLDWPGNIDVLPVVAAPPTPTPTYTALPQPQITSLYFHPSSRSIAIQIRGLQPGEMVFATVSNAKSGDVVGSASYTANAKGRINSWWIHTDEKLDGNYILTLVTGSGITIRYPFTHSP